MKQKRRWLLINEGYLFLCLFVLLCFFLPIGNYQCQPSHAFGRWRREKIEWEVSFSQSLFLLAHLAPTLAPKYWHFKKSYGKCSIVLYLFSGTKNQPVRLYIQPEWPCFVVFQQSNVRFDPLFTFVGLATQSDTPVWTNLNPVLIVSVLWVTCEKYRNISLSFDQ